MKKLLSSLLLSSMISAQALACSFSGVNEMTGSKNSSGLPDSEMIKTEAELEKILGEFRGHWNKRLKKSKTKVTFKSLWKSNVYNAWVFNSEKRGGKFEPISGIVVNAGPETLTRRIEMTGEFARRSSPDMVRLTLCHELGHVFGGYPRFAKNKEASVEGQADYYASAKCMKLMLQNDVAGNKQSAEDQVYEFGSELEQVKSDCQASYTLENDQNICVRTAKAGRALARGMNSWSRQLLSFEKMMDLPGVSKTNEEHPANICRLATYYNGALCNISPGKSFDNKKPDVGACTVGAGFQENQIRPSCWYAQK